MIGDTNWPALSPEEKRKERFDRWLSPGTVTFSNKKAEAAYKARVTRFIKAISLEEPDRVPVNLPTGYVPAYHAGVDLKTVMYDYKELSRAWIEFMNEFEMDTFSGPGLVYPGRVLDQIDYRLNLWPGHGLADDVTAIQFVEGEYMKADEYEAFIRDPAGFLLSTYLPRTTKAFAGFRKLGPMTNAISIPINFIGQFGDPEVRKSVYTLLDAASEMMKWREVVGDVTKAVRAAGLPSLAGAMSGAPFDRIGDTLRGTKGVMTDMYRRPGELLEAMERLAPLLIEQGIRGGNASECPIVLMPLHKGAGSFMSNKQFETFYWPTLKKVMMAYINEGLVPMPFAEGDYEPRLDIITDMPKASVIWLFEVMDMAKAKRVVGTHACIAGNLPVSILCTGSPDDVKKGCRQLIETCAPGGGYILAGSAHVENGNPQNLRAMMEAAKEYGVYKR
jgi:uroporphyrinogen-III decarboxylase